MSEISNGGIAVLVVMGVTLGPLLLFAICMAYRLVISDIKEDLRKRHERRYFYNPKYRDKVQRKEQGK